MADKKSNSLDERIKRLQAIKDKQTKAAQLRKTIDDSRAALKKLRSGK